MYVKLHYVDNQWFRDDNGALVGEIVDTYYNVYYGKKQPIIKTCAGNYIRPIYGRIDPKKQSFVPLCQGLNLHLCAGPFCKGFLENPNICPRYKDNSTDGYYILLD